MVRTKLIKKYILYKRNQENRRIILILLDKVEPLIGPFSEKILNKSLPPLRFVALSDTNTTVWMLANISHPT
jgi:hypothetical protein